MGTTISSNTIIDQTFINNNPGPYTINGNATVITINNITLNNSDQFFIIGKNNVTIQGTSVANRSIITIPTIGGYLGLVQNRVIDVSGQITSPSYNNIIIQNLNI